MYLCSMQFPFPSPSFPLLLFPLEVGPLNPAKRPGIALQAPPAGFGVEPQPKSNLVHFSFEISHLVATVLMISPKLYNHRNHNQNIEKAFLASLSVAVGLFLEWA